MVTGTIMVTRPQIITHKLEISDAPALSTAIMVTWEISDDLQYILLMGQYNDTAEWTIRQIAYNYYGFWDQDEMSLPDVAVRKGSSVLVHQPDSPYLPTFTLFGGLNISDTLSASPLLDIKLSYLYPGMYCRYTFI
jgi:hypothetical protein